jgi:hypothetical protein
MRILKSYADVFDKNIDEWFLIYKYNLHCNT